MKPLKIVVLSGSVREDSYTDRAVAVLSGAAAREPGIVLEWWNPATLDLPLPGRTPSNDDAERLRAAVKGADGVVFVTPEYHGSMSSVTKLVIDNLGFPSTLAGKPVALLGVAAGRIGAIQALGHLRSVLSHVGAIVLPGSVSIANVRQEFAEDGSLRDPAVAKLVPGLLAGLVEFLAGRRLPA